MNRFINARSATIIAQVGLVAFGSTAPIVCGSQVIARETIIRRDARETLTQFETTARQGRSAIPDAVLHPENYSATTVDSVVAGLENLALSGESELVRSEAAIALASAGSANHPIPGAFEAKVKVYERSTSNLVRGMIINFIDTGQERQRAIEFLKSTAISVGPPRFDEAPFLAAQHLGFMGAEGRAVLAELHSSGKLKDPRARGYVQWLLTTTQQ